MPEWIVLSEESGLKLIVFLKNHLDASFSAKQLKRIIEQNACKINGRVERFASTLVGKGDHISLSFPKQSVPLHFEFEPSRLLFEDDSLLAYNKPAGLACDPEGILAVIKQYSPCLLVHRLDRQTTGVLLISKTKEVTDRLIEQFRNFQFEKSYQAIVDKKVSKPKGIIENYLGKIRVYEGQSIWGAVHPKKGQYARTEWERLTIGKNASLLRCFPKTGRTHQIRVHLAEMGHPILGDYQYGGTLSCPYEPARILLHAEKIAFHHPLTGQPLIISAPLPDDFKQAIAKLGLA